MKNNLIKKISTGIGLGLILLTNACEKCDKILKDYCSTYTINVEPYDGYDKYSLQLKERYPKTLGNIDYRDISIFLKDELNNGKMLMKNGDITLPDYDCIEFTPGNVLS